MIRIGRTLLAVAALASALCLGAPAVALAEDCIGCNKGEPAVDLDISGQLIPSNNGWSAVEFVITPHFPLLDRLPRYIPPTHLYLGFRDPNSVNYWGLSYWPPLTCDYDFALGVFDCLLPTFSSVDGPKQIRFIASVNAPGAWDTWGRFTATVDPRNYLAEYDEWNNVASVDLPLWPDRQIYELSTGDLDVKYYRFPPQ